MQHILVRWLSLTLCCLAAAGCPRPMRVADQTGAEARAAGAEARKAAADAKKAAAEAKKAAAAKKTQTPPAANPPAKDTRLTLTVEGWGKTEEDAKKYALQKASAKVMALMDPPLLWTPPADFVLKNLIVGEPERRADQDMQVNGEQLKCWCWTLKLPPDQIEAMRREDAKFRAQLALQERSGVAQERMLDLGKLVVWMVLALSGVWLYIRADRWLAAKRRRWMRIVLTGVLAVSSVGWWLLS
jgi:hypothetical protein